MLFLCKIVRNNTRIMVKKTIINIILIASLLIIVDAKKDDILKDFILDMAIGGGLEICSKYNTCRVALRLITFGIIMAYLLNWISRGCKCNCRMPTDREFNRGIRAVSGMYIGRSLVRSFNK